jgi:exonuclease SbcC
LAEAAGLTASRGVGVERADEAVAALEAAQGTLERLARVAAAADALRDAAADEARALKGLQEAEAQAQAAAATQATAEREQAQTESALATAQTAFEAATAGLDHARRGWERFREGAAAAAKLDAETAAARNEIEVRSAAAQAAGAAAEAVEATLTAACAELNERRRNAAIHQISAGLRPGDPCPVCGVALASAVHIDAGAPAGVVAAAEAESSLRQALAVAQRDATREEAQTEATTTRLADLEQRLMAALGEAKDLAAAMAELESRTEAVAAREEAAAGRRAELEARRSECESARRRGSTAAAQAAGCSAAAESARATVSEVRRRSDEASTALADHFDGVVPLDASEQVAAQRGRLAGALDAARSARTARDAAARDESAARATAEGERRRLGEIDVALAGLRARAEAVARTLAGEIALGVPPGVNGDRGASITGVRTWGETAGAAVARERDQTTARSTTVQAEVVSIAAGLGWDCASGADALAALQRADREAGQAVVRAAGAVERAVERVTQRRALEAQIADERRQVAVLGELAQDLRQDRFGEYIVQETLGVLAARASEELLRISDGRYSLVTDEGDFDVVDHANADERRSVKTLSGGETFLASLSLALSLSRHIGELASEGLGAKLEAVFIDEGFGTLDPATLDEVNDALERLREDDLIVGVISHVPELAQRIGIGLEVRKDEGRSQVIMNLESPASAP